MRITITGTRDTDDARAGHYQKVFDRFLAPFATAGHQFLVGGAVGIDTHALGWLTGHRLPVTVVVPATVEDQPDLAASLIRKVQQDALATVVELRNAAFPEAEAYHARNRWMVDRSQLTIGFPCEGQEGGGTWYTLDYTAAKGLPRLIVPV